MKRTILTILAGSLAAVTLGATAAHADEWRGEGRDAEVHERYDRRDEHRRERERDREREQRRYHGRRARIDVRDGDRGVIIDLGRF